MGKHHSEAQQVPLPDEVAQRLLARVVELDVYGRTTTSVCRLREVTRELGIPDETFDRALRELTTQQSATSRLTNANPPSPLGQSWWGRLLRPAVGRSFAEEVLVNAGVFAAFFGALGLASRFIRLVEGDWPLHAGLFVVINVAAVTLARRYRARPMMYVLAVTAVAQAVEYAMHLTFGIRAVQGGPTHWAVMLAAAVAMFLTPMLRTGDNAGATVSEGETESPTPSGSLRRTWWSAQAAAKAT